MTNIVIVNNNPIQLKEMKERLLDIYSGIRVTEFTDAMSSVNYVCSHTVDVVIAEAQMRRVNGIQLLRVIRSQKPNQAVVLLAKDNNMQEEAQKQAVDGYYITPITQYELDEIFRLTEYCEA